MGTAEAIVLVKKNIPNKSLQEAAMDISLALYYTRPTLPAIQYAEVCLLPSSLH